MMRHLIIPELAADMQRVEEKLSEKLAPVSWDPAVCRILEEVRLAEGKMIRPQVLLLCGMCGSRYRENSDRICVLAALVEMVHMASLIHDDIVDDSPFRRGRPTVQSAFGKDMAVYAGDLLLSRVMQVLFEEELVKEGRLFSAAIGQMCTGEIGQYDCCYRTDTGISRYMNNIYGKTAAVFELSCRLGAMTGGCSPETTDVLAQFGRQLGLLFQIRDDLLDFTSYEEVDGKPGHMDFREGVLTLPVLYSLECESVRPEIIQLVCKARAAELTKEDIRHLDALLEESGGMEMARQKAGELAVSSVRLAEQLPHSRIRSCFTGMIRQLSDVAGERQDENE